ncbi:MAG TPA: hypothetical protein VGK23_09650 [Methanomassiliicoccales archaeon]
MKTENRLVRSEKGKAVRKSRWRKDADGRFHYSGACPFNHTVCWLRNRHADKTAVRNVEEPQ